MGDLYVASAPHQCSPPARGERSILFYPAARNAGSVWSCDDCGRLWEAVATWIGPQWVRARPETRERYADHPTTKRIGPNG